MDRRRTRATRARRDSLKNETTRDISPSRRRISPARKASPARRASPARKASPGRKASPARRASPSRKASPAKRRSPGRRASPSRKASPSGMNPEPTKAATISPSLKKTSSMLGLGQNVNKTSSIRSTKTTYSTRTINVGGSEADAEIALITALGEQLRARRSVSNAVLISETPTESHLSRSQSRSVYDTEEPTGTEYSRTEYSDNEVDEDNSRDQFKSVLYDSKINAPVARQIKIPREFGGLIGTNFLLIAIPIISFYLLWCCSKTSCEFKKISLTGWNLKYFEKVFDIRAVTAFVGFQIVIYLLSSFPFGRTVRLDRNNQKFYFNTLTISLLGVITYIIAEMHFKLNVGDFIIRYYSRFCLFGILNALILSLWLYNSPKWNKREYLSNPYGKTGKFIIDYGLGREIDPKWFNVVNIKLAHYRISILSLLIICLVFLCKIVKVPSIPPSPVLDNMTLYENFLEISKYIYTETTYDKNALFAVVLLSLYTWDSIMFEHHLATSFELQQEGCGALVLLRYALAPFYMASIPKLFLEHTSAKTCIMGQFTIGIIFILGLILKRYSNSIKYAYRMNPLAPLFSSFETVPTFQGRRLLLGRLWGSVRQPNYAGELICLLSLGALLIWNFAYPPLVCLSILILFLLHRSARVNTRNFDRYSSAWTRYCTKVKYVLIPKVY